MNHSNTPCGSQRIHPMTATQTHAVSPPEFLEQGDRAPGLDAEVQLSHSLADAATGS